MKKATMTVSFDEEKLNALKMYLGQKGQQLEGELAKALDTLYTRNVPAGVREFIHMRSGAGPAPAPKPAYKKKPDPSPPPYAGAAGGGQGMGSDADVPL